MQKLIRFLSKIIRPGTASQVSMEGEPRIIKRSQHNISRQNISPNCCKVLYRLEREGYQAFLVGGSVRDLLLGYEPKDFDVATNATPEEVRRLFRNCRLIGRRFRLAHVYFKQEVIEVATFRTNEPHGRETSDEGIVIRDNIYGTLADDVLRRDFTVNALLYNIKSFSVLDYVNGLEDLNHGILRLIGDPLTRYREDPVRILRAIRFAAKLGFRLEEKTAAPIPQCAPLLRQIASARLFEEVNKLFLNGHGAKTFSLLLQYDLFGLLFPETQQLLNDPLLNLEVDRFLQVVFQATDERVRNGQSVNILFLLAALLWYPQQQRLRRYETEELPQNIAKEKAAEEILSKEMDIIEIPRRMHHLIADIWNMQFYLEVRRGKRPFRMINHPQFSMAYDFLLLRAKADPALLETASWWTTFCEASHEERQQLVYVPNSSPRRHRPFKKRRPQTSPPSSTES